MEKSRIAAIVMLLVSTGQCLMAADDLVNGSFEDNGIIGDLRVKAPDGWDVNVPAGKFSCGIQVGWPTEGRFNLAIQANWFIRFSGGEMATVSQMLVLDDVEKIGFDLMLRTANRTTWDPNVCQATVLIDEELVWQAEPKSDVRGEYLDQACTIDDKFRDGQPHRVSLGLKMNVSGMQFEIYESLWDSIEATPFCNGGGLLPGDVNRDCYVNHDDLMMMAAMWLVEVPSSSRYNLSLGAEEEFTGTVDFFDLAVFGGNWLADSLQEQEIGS